MSAMRQFSAFLDPFPLIASPAGERIRRFTIVTTAPNELCAELHNRMPVILAPEAWPAWLGAQPADGPQLKSLPAPTLPMIGLAGR